MQKITYKDMVDRYGNTQAFDLLLLIENLAKIKNDLILMDENTRFERAIEALNQTDFAA